MIPPPGASRVAVARGRRRSHSFSTPRLSPGDGEEWVLCAAGVGAPAAPCSCTHSAWRTHACNQQVLGLGPPMRLDQAGALACGQQVRSQYCHCLDAGGVAAGAAAAAAMRPCLLPRLNTTCMQRACC